ncbi:MAG: hypothetical protein ACQEQH_06470 [Bacillota bacterium]
MKKNYLKEYVLLVLRIDKLFKKEDSFYIDAYIGPESLKAHVENEDFSKPVKLIEETNKLLNNLDDMDFEVNRKKFLKKHLLAFKTILQILNDDNMDFKEQVKNILDVNIVWTDEKEFEEGLKLFDIGLPGCGNLNSRYNEWLQRNTYSFQSGKHMLEFIDDLIKAIRNFSKHIVDLPEDDHVLIDLVSDKNYGASTRYIGNYNSKLNINKDIPFNFFQAVPLIAHELYPGHHTEFCIKEKHLVKEKDYFESRVFLLNSPQLVITEGIGEVAFDMIFSNDSFLVYLKNEIYKKYNIKIGDVDLKSILKASRINSIDQIGNNVVMMLEAGRSEDEIKSYVKKYTLQPDFMIEHLLSNIKSSKFKKIYSTAYYQGKKLVQDYLNEGNQKKRFNKLLKTQCYPTMLRE